MENAQHSTESAINTQLHKMASSWIQGELGVQVHHTEMKAKVEALVGHKGQGSEGLKRAAEFYAQHAIKTSHPMFMNQLWAGYSESGVLAESLGAALNTSMYTYEVAPVATLVELQVVELLGRLAGFPQAQGTFVPGASYGNMMGLLCARQKLKPEIKNQGLQDRLQVFVSKDSHYSFLKAANIMGIGESNVVKVDTDPRGRMCPKALNEAIAKSKKDGARPFVVGVTAGTTVRASFDPIDAIADICEQEDIWMHVDGALGGSLLFSEDKKKDYLKGIHRADSLIFNMHKMMGVPIHCSAFLCSRPSHLGKTTGLSASETSYLFHDDHAPDLGMFSLQCGRKADVLKFWLQWVELGLEGFQNLVDQIFSRAQFAENFIQNHEKLEMIGGPRESVTVCFQYKHYRDHRDDELNRSIRDTLMNQGDLAINYGTVHERLSLRIVPFNPDLKEEHLTDLLEKIVECGDRLTS